MKTIKQWEKSNKDWEINVTYIWEYIRMTTPKIQVWNKILTDNDIKELWKL